MPPAYVIGQLEVHDDETYASYRAQTPQSIAEFGGKFIVRGGRFETLEGEPPLPRIVVIAFPSYEQAKAWYESESYRKLIPIRQQAATSRLFLVEGAEG